MSVDSIHGSRVVYTTVFTWFPLTWKFRELIWSGNFVDGQGKMMCIVRVASLLFIFVEENQNTHSVHVITKWWWKGVGVGDEERTKNYIKLVDAPQVSQRIMPDTVEGSQGISFSELSGKPALAHRVSVDKWFVCWCIMTMLGSLHCA